MKQKQKIFKTYSGYGKHPLTDAEVLVRVSQVRKRYQCKPVSKLYVRKTVGTGHHVSNTFHIKALMKRGYSYEEACKIA